ncbi:hypothetical protein RHSIM_Rhsim02G0038200 [Rhododendron simsii]|uniref:Uncharacterized protein n=1 Tax=Rhododendron simsii TaxID=118357 RepID=A0A834HDZ5_RHOSS|nr:hypothetical protein RHSIM_Rhsim02G0038200 [Rhododendron simsii]
MAMSETLEDINAQFETFFLSTNRDAVPESHSSLPADSVFDQRNESANRQYHRTEDKMELVTHHKMVKILSGIAMKVLHDHPKLQRAKDKEKLLNNLNLVST